MENVKLKCPKCGNYVNGQFTRSTGNKAVRAVAKKGGATATGALLGNLIPGLGTLTGVGVGLLIDAFADSVEKSDCNYDFVCGKCGSVYSYTKEEAEEITKREEEKAKEKAKVYGVFYLLIYILFLFGAYCLLFTNLTHENHNWTTLGWTILVSTIISGSITLIWSFCIELGNAIAICITSFCFWILAKGINLFMYADITGATGSLTSDGWWAWGLTIIGGLLVIPAIIVSIACSGIWEG